MIKFDTQLFITYYGNNHLISLSEIDMSIKKILLLSLMSLVPNLAYTEPSNIQRYSWVGQNNDGTVIAVMLRHFGPSSHAPFANLIIKKAGVSMPLFTDTASKWVGDESDLEELGLYLIEKNTDKMQEYGIDLSNQVITEANFVLLSIQPGDVASGWIDIENVGMEEFSIKIEQSVDCPNNPPVMEYWLKGIKVLDSIQRSDFCESDSYFVRNIFRTKKALWFILMSHLNVMGMDTYWINMDGVQF